MNVIKSSKPIKNTDELVNENIPFKELLVISDTGEQLGVLPTKEAIKKAYEKELDLVVVAANAKPAVAKFMDYSKFRFDQQKKSKELKKNQKITQVKEIRLGATIQKHDFETKVRSARKFIENGDKVKVSIRFMGRMIVHADLGKKIINDFAVSMADIAIVESQPKMEGKTLYMILAPKIEK